MTANATAGLAAPSLRSLGATLVRRRSHTSITVGRLVRRNVIGALGVLVVVLLVWWPSLLNG
jgi:hypothetical protein